MVAFDDDVFEVELSGETLDKTTFGDAKVGQSLNLERAMQLGDRLGGHLVSGHVDGVGEVISVADVGEMKEFKVRVPAELGKFFATKGSIVLDGVSLTTNLAEKDVVSLTIIPHTLAVTTIGSWAPGTRVHVEVDLIARYVERLLKE